MVSTVRDVVTAELSLAQDDINLDSKDNYGRTPIAWAALNGYSAVVEMLLAQGADITSTNIEGQSPLLLAAQGGHVTMVTLLLAREDVDLNARDEHGGTPRLRTGVEQWPVTTST